MKVTSTKNFIGLLLTMCLLQNAYSMMPVFDAGAITQLVSNLHQLETQYELLNKTYSNAKDQLSEAKAIQKDAEGHYGYGGLLNSAQDLTDREWSPSTWQQTLQGLSGGNPARYQELLATYKKNHPTLSQSEYKNNTSTEKAATYQQDVSVNQAASVNSTYAFDDIKKHLQTIHTLSESIDQAQNTKSAMDLNSRLLAEVAYIQTQELKMQILLNQQIVQQNADSISEKTQAAKFNSLPQQ